MITGLTIKQSEAAWDNDLDVLCPGCERHIEEDNAIVYHHEIWHPDCAKEDRRINIAAERQEFDYDPQR